MQVHLARGDPSGAVAPGHSGGGGTQGPQATLIMAKRLRCYLGFHRWKRIHDAEGGGFYNRCRDCGRFSGSSPTPPISPFLGENALPSGFF